MELLSKPFENALEKAVFPALENNQITLLVTIPSANKTRNQIIDRFREQGKVFEITKSNQNNIQCEIFEFLIK